jgi:hypothetical protein
MSRVEVSRECSSEKSEESIIWNWPSTRLTSVPSSTQIPIHCGEYRWQPYSAVEARLILLQYGVSLQLLCLRPGAPELSEIVLCSASSYSVVHTLTMRSRESRELVMDRGWIGGWFEF